MVWTTLLLLFLSFFPPAPKAARPPQARELSSLLDETAHLPVEYQAAILFSALDHAPALLTPAQKQRRLLDLAERASTAHFASNFFYGGPFPSQNSPLIHEESLAVAGSHADQLEIELGVVHRLLALHSSEPALALFQSIRLPAAPVSCEQAAVPLYGPYFTTWSEFGPTLPLPEAVSAINSPGALLGYLDALQSAQLDREAWTALAGSLARAIDALSPTDRELNALDRWEILTKAVSAVLTRLDAERVPAAQLLASYRSFLTRGLGGETCADASLDRAKVIDRFNSLRAIAKTDVPAIEPRELKGTPGRSAKIDVVPFDDDLREAGLRLFTLSDGNRNRHYRDHAPDLQPDPSDVRFLLDRARLDYSGSQACALCRFVEYRSMLDTLYIVLPSGPSSRAVIDDYVRFIQLNPVEEQDPALWLPFVMGLFNTSRPADAAAEKALEARALKGGNLLYIPSGDAGYIRTQLARSPDPILHALWRAEVLIRPPYEAFLPPETP